MKDYTTWTPPQLREKLCQLDTEAERIASRLQYQTRRDPYDMDRLNVLDREIQDIKRYMRAEGIEIV